MNKYINRNAEQEVLSLAKQFPVVMITGPRQVGKSTMLNYIGETFYKKMNYVSLDSIKDRTLALKDPELFLENYETPLIIDEFQYAPNLLSYIKIKVDNQKTKNTFASKNDLTAMYYLTGSQSFLSMKGVSESLAGRVGIIDLYGLSTRELNGGENSLFVPDIDKLKKMGIPPTNLTNKELFQRIFKGGFPETYKNKDILLEKYFENYVKTYIERDIRDIINVKNEIKFMKFITSIAARTGQELNASDVAKDVETSVPTVNEWLSVLVNTGLVILLETYDKNILKRVVKRPKIYFMDTGLACYLTKYPNSTVLENSAYAGHIFETFVVSEIIKSFANNGLNAKRHLYYYRDNSGREIDLVMEYNNKLYPIEIKKSKNPGSEATKNFGGLEETKKEIAPGIVLCMIDQIFPIDRNNYAVPIWYI